MIKVVVWHVGGQEMVKTDDDQVLQETGLCGFCSKFHTLSSSAKMLKIGRDLTKLQRV